MRTHILNILSNVVSNIIIRKIKNHPASAKSESGYKVTYINNSNINIHINK